MRVILKHKEIQKVAFHSEMNLGVWGPGDNRAATEPAHVSFEL
jgi:hypothetical protein